MLELFDLFVKIGADVSGVDKGIDDTKGKLSSFGSSVMSGIGSVVDKTVKITAAGIAAASGAVAKLTSDAVAGYADYEQLVGGVETLFGKSEEETQALIKSMQDMGMTERQITEEMDKMSDATDIVMDNAANAYKTAGLSANQYMETVTSMAAAMKQSTSSSEEAAEKANMAITDMADNANKMGTSMDAIQNAYAGFTKQNFTMLDNLKLGYGGTKTEMERLLADAEKIKAANGEMVDYSIDKYADIVDAIHVVQTEYGITGTTAKEAASTVSGSIASFKSAWENLVAGLANPDADLGVLIDNAISSAETALNNLLPVAERAITGISNALGTVIPAMSERLPELVDQILPSLITAATSIVSGLVEALPAILQVLIEQIPPIISQLLPVLLELVPQLVSLGGQLVEGLIQGITDNMDSVTEKANELIVSFGEWITQNAPSMIEAAANLILTLAEGLSSSIPTLLPTIVEVALSIAEGLIDNADQLVDSAIAIIMALAEGLINALPKLTEKAPEIVKKLVDSFIRNAPKLIQAAVELIVKLAKGLVDNTPKIVEAGLKILGELVAGIISNAYMLYDSATEVVGQFKEGITGFFSDAWQWGSDLIHGFVDGIKSAYDSVVGVVEDIANAIRERLHFSEPDIGPLADFSSYAPDMMQLFAKGIRDNEKLVTDQIEKSFDFSDVILDQNVNAKGGYGGNSVVINVNGYNRNPNELAELISRKIDSATTRRQVAMGVA